MIRSYLKYEFIKENSTDFVVLRNYLVSPFTEEFVFRSCMIPLVYQVLGGFYSMLVTPLFFGVAHLHHIIEGYFVTRLPLDILIAQHLFQFSYTYLFGIYSSYLFMRTGNFYASFASHVFCNFMGFPNINDLLYEFDRRATIVIVVSYLVGFVSFFCIIDFGTEPGFYGNGVFVID